MSVYTKRVYPYAVGRIDGRPGNAWTDPENAMDPDNGLYAFRFNDGSGNYAYQTYRLKLEIPTMAHIEAARWIVRGRYESEALETNSISLYAWHTLDAEGNLDGLGRLDTVAPFGRDWTTVIVDATFGGNRLVNTLNERREIRDLFSIEARANNLSGPSTVYCDWLAIEIDYTLPEFPLQGEMRIEE